MSKKFVFDDALNALTKKITSAISAVDTRVTDNTEWLHDKIVADVGRVQTIVGAEIEALDTALREVISTSESTLRGEIESVQSILQSVIDAKLPKTGGTISNNLTVNKNLAVNGTITGNVTGDVTGKLSGTARDNAGTLSIDTISSSSDTISAGGNKTFTFDVGKRGATGVNTIAIVGFELSGTGTGNCCLYRYYLSGTTATFYVHNTGTTQATCTVKAHVLYETKNATF